MRMSIVHLTMERRIGRDGMVRTSDRPSDGRPPPAGDPPPVFTGETVAVRIRRRRRRTIIIENKLLLQVRERVWGRRRLMLNIRPWPLSHTSLIYGTLSRIRTSLNRFSSTDRRSSPLVQNRRINRSFLFVNLGFNKFEKTKQKPHWSTCYCSAWWGKKITIY